MYKRENHSLARINKKLLMHINQWFLLNQDIDPRIITMTTPLIETSADLGAAKVYVQHTDDLPSLVKKLNRHTHPIHQYLFKNLDIRKIPKITFKPMHPKGESIHDILDQIDGKNE